jgi:hypothetical protein
MCSSTGSQNRPGILGVTVGEQFQRALEVGEEHGHLLPLALQRSLGREDLLGEVPGRVRVRRDDALSTRRSGHRLPACETEGCARRQLPVALGARQRETGAALHTEVCLGRILLPAPGTRHAVALQSLSRRTLNGCTERSGAAGAGQGHPRVTRKRSVAQLNATARAPLASAVAVSVAMMAGSKTSLRRPAKGRAFRGVPEAEDAGSQRNEALRGSEWVKTGG